jgi:hypothetical protein
MKRVWHSKSKNKNNTKQETNKKEVENKLFKKISIYLHRP